MPQDRLGHEHDGRARTGREHRHRGEFGFIREKAPRTRDKERAKLAPVKMRHRIQRNFLRATQLEFGDDMTNSLHTTFLRLRLDTRIGFSAAPRPASLALWHLPSTYVPSAHSDQPSKFLDAPAQRG